MPSLAGPLDSAEVEDAVVQVARSRGLAVLCMALSYLHARHSKHSRAEELGIPVLSRLPCSTFDSLRARSGCLQLQFPSGLSTV